VAFVRGSHLDGRSPLGFDVLEAFKDAVEHGGLRDIDVRATAGDVVVVRVEFYMVRRPQDYQPGAAPTGEVNARGVMLLPRRRGNGEET
jgi:hypothetical protein